MAPELRLLDPDTLRFPQPTFASDVYAFGVLACEVLTRQVPFAGRDDLRYDRSRLEKLVAAGGRPALDAALLPAGTPPSVVALVQSCWAGDPADRPTAGAVVAALGDALDAVCGDRTHAVRVPLDGAVAARLAELSSRAAATAPGGGGNGKPVTPIAVTASPQQGAAHEDYLPGGGSGGVAT
jgi:serine/threonine protein kinase